MAGCVDRAGSCERCGNTAEGIADLADFVWEHAGDDGLVVLEA
jgi:hypothetical protein